MNYKLPYTGSEIAAILEKAANGQVLSFDEKNAVQILTAQLTAGDSLMTPEQVENLSKAAKVYNCENATELTQEQQDEILNGQYNFIKTNAHTYLITVNIKANLQFIEYDVEEQTIYTYWYDSGDLNSGFITIGQFNNDVMKAAHPGDVLTIDDNNYPEWLAPVTGTKLYRYKFNLTSGLYIYVVTEKNVDVPSTVNAATAGSLLLNLIGGFSDLRAISCILTGVSWTGAANTSTFGYFLGSGNKTAGTVIEKYFVFTCDSIQSDPIDASTQVTRFIKVLTLSDISSITKTPL